MTNSVSKIGPYTIETEIGRGGMAIVYRAQDMRSGRIVALKVLSSQANRNRFLREAETAKRLQHPNIVQVYESGEADGYYYIAMEYADGGTLTQRLRNVAGPIELTETLSILQPVAIALDYAHSQGLLHRDIKSSNILLSSSGRILLTDFGVAQEMDDDATQVTIAGYSVGTPAYMSPEQARGVETLDARSDIYSLGVVAYEMLIGRRPHQADSSLVLLRKIADDPPTPPEVANPQINPNIAYVLRCVLSKDRSLRYLTASEFVHALKQASAISSASSQRVVNTNHKQQPKRSSAYGRYLPLLIGLIILAAFFYWLAKDWLPTYKTLITIVKPVLVTTEVELTPATAMEAATPTVSIPNQTQPTSLQLASTLTETNVATITATFTPVPVPTPTEWILQDQTVNEIGIQISVPPEWSVEQHNSLHTFYNKDRTALFFVDRIYPTSSVTSTSLLLTEYLAQGNAPIHSTQPIAEHIIQYKNYSVVEQGYEFILLGGTPALAKLRVFEDNGRFFVFGTLTVAAKAQEFANVFEQIFNTLILLPDPIPSPSATPTQTATKTVTSTQTATPTATTTPSSTRTPTNTQTPTPTITATSTTAVTDTPTITTTVIESLTQKITSVITPTLTDTQRVTLTNTSIATMPRATITAPATHTEPIITPTLIFTMAPTKTASATSTKTPLPTTTSVTPTPLPFTPTEDMVMTLVAIDTMIAALQTQLPASVTATETELPTLTMTPTTTPTQTLTPTRLPTRISTTVLPKSATIQTADSELACSNGAERNWYNKMDVNLSVSPNVKLPRNISYELIAYEAGFSPLIVDNRHAYVIGQFDQKTSTKLDLTKLNPSPKYSLAIALFFKNAASDKKRLIIGWGDCTIKISQ